MNPIVVIPARLASTRLPGKPLADIGGKPMIVHMLERGREAGIGPVAVACGDPEIADAVRKAAMTSASDRSPRCCPAPDWATTLPWPNWTRTAPTTSSSTSRAIFRRWTRPASVW